MWPRFPLLSHDTPAFYLPDIVIMIRKSTDKQTILYNMIQKSLVRILEAHRFPLKKHVFTRLSKERQLLSKEQKNKHRYQGDPLPSNISSIYDKSKSSARDVSSQLQRMIKLNSAANEKLSSLKLEIWYQRGRISLRFLGFRKASKLRRDVTKKNALFASETRLQIGFALPLQDAAYTLFAIAQVLGHKDRIIMRKNSHLLLKNHEIYMLQLKHKDPFLRELERSTCALHYLLQLDHISSE